MTDRIMQSDYMHWAKFKPPVRYPLTSSEVPHFRMDRLPIDVEDLDMDGASHPRYAPLREAIGKRYGFPTGWVVAADGTSMANFLAMAALITPGDEVLIEHPTYEPLVGAASFLGGRIKRFDRKAEEEFRIDPAAVFAATSERTRLIVLTNLHNPSGALVDDDVLGELGAMAAERKARILIDEVYLDSAVPPRRSAAHLGPEFAITNGLTKVYGLSGLRCGWIVADPNLAERMWRLNDLFGVNQAHQAERLACIAFDHLDEINGGNPQMLARNRTIWNQFVADRDDLECMVAKHGITVFPRWRGGDTEQLATLLRERYDTAVVPGRWFEMPDRFRVGLGLSTDIIEEGLDRLGRALDDMN
ncbi:MAG TPA: pyridoxal phosphate-dependent aminotransferase [Sphingomicrobium sp.]|nr:pyridoxal phosphate-dependent aminotransferase [Sphingomicrobium sp.]